MVWAGYEFIIYSFPGLLVALRYCLHGGFPSVFKTDGEDCGDSRLPQQPDQPLPLHDHQQRRQGWPREFPLLQQSEAEGCWGDVNNFILSDEARIKKIFSQEQDYSPSISKDYEIQEQLSYTTWLNKYNFHTN